MRITEDGWFGIGFVFLFVVCIGVIAGSAYFGSESQYRDKALAASVEIAKLRHQSQPCEVFRDRLDAIMAQLEKIERGYNANIDAMLVRLDRIEKATLLKEER